MKFRRGICKECQKEAEYGKPSLKLCKVCNAKRLQAKKTFTSGAKSHTPKSKNTGEKELFLEIWNERPHVSEISGKALGNEPNAFFFFHILGKGAYPKARIDKENIILTTMQEHIDWHSIGKEKLLEKEPKFSKVYEMQKQLKQKYSDL